MKDVNISNLILEKIVEKCLNVYLKLPKSGKPNVSEWTVLSCIIQYNNKTAEHEIVSLGTGSKCIGPSKMCPEGSVLNDSHAEVIARRGFLLYLYNNILQLLHKKKSIFEKKEGNVILKDEICFLFYSSQMPCGDASIMLKSEEDCIGEVVCNQKHKAESDSCDIDRKKVKIANDIHRTGAKCLPQTVQDPKLSGKNYHLVGQVRTKPGRGERTLSVSCSDKIAKWIHMGIQGALLDLILSEPIYIAYFIFGAGTPYSDESLKRAFFKRSNVKIMPKVVPKFYQTSLKFVHLKNECQARPASASIVYVNTTPRLLEVAVRGTKLGLTKKKVNSYKSLCVSKYNMYKQYLKILNMHDELKHGICGEETINLIPYNSMKQKSNRYKDNWRRVKESLFKTWTVKPDIWRFCVNDF